MKLPVDIRFVGLAPSPALETAIRDKVQRLDDKFAQAIAWRVVVEQPHRAHRQGRDFAVRLDVTLPGHEVAIGNFENEDAFVAVRDAFAAAARRLQQVVDIDRGDVKAHAGNGRPAAGDD